MNVMLMMIPMIMIILCCCWCYGDGSDDADNEMSVLMMMDEMMTVMNECDDDDNDDDYDDDYDDYDNDDDDDVWQGTSNGHAAICPIGRYVRIHFTNNRTGLFEWLSIILQIASFKNSNNKVKSVYIKSALYFDTLCHLTELIIADCDFYYYSYEFLTDPLLHYKKETIEHLHWHLLSNCFWTL